MIMDPTLALAQRRASELQAEARRDALARLVTCCRPSAWRRAGASALARLRAVRPTRSEATCCA